MFAKLLKYEWRSCRRILFTLCAATLASGVTSGLAGVYLTWTGGRKSYVLATLILFAAMMAIGICAAGGFLYLIWRFYQSRFTDEGYLTFTLPVSNHQQLLAALLNILRGSFLVFLAALGAIAMAGLVYIIAFFPRDVNLSEFFQLVREYLPIFLDAINWFGCLEVLVYLLSGLLSEVLVLMLSVTAGAVLARKHRLLTIAAVYFGIQLLQLWGLFRFGLATASLNLWGYTMPVNLATAAAGYFLIHWMTEKKLNLT